MGINNIWELPREDYQIYKMLIVSVPISLSGGRD